MSSDEYGYEEGSNSRPIHELPSEESLLGACLLSQRAIATSMAIVTADDFYKPAHGFIYNVICNLFENGEPVDPVTVSSELSKTGMLQQSGGAGYIVNLQAATPSTSNAEKYAKNVATAADARRVQRVALQTSQNISSLIDPIEVIEETIASLREIGIGRTDSLPNGVSLMADFLDRPQEQRPEWIIPGIMRVGWRVILTATEGAGKTWLLRQIAASAAAGIHAFQPHESIPAKKVLLVDLENPPEHIDESMEKIQKHCESAPNYDRDNLWLWHAPEGIDLRSRSDRAKFDNLLREVKPDLVCLGPVYKSYHLSARETDEIAVREVQETLDDLRTRHSFGLIMEHHAAKASGGGKRSLDPYGSSFWMRWAEIGIGMEAQQDSEDVIMGRWRGDRLKNSWPESLYRSSPFPWGGRWADGSMSRGATAPARVESPYPLRSGPMSDEF